MILITIIVVIIASVISIRIYYKKNQEKKTDEYVETYKLPSSPNTRDHAVATSDNHAYKLLPTSESTQPTVAHELPMH